MPIVGCGRDRKLLVKILFAVLDRVYIGRNSNVLVSIP